MKKIFSIGPNGTRLLETFLSMLIFSCLLQSCCFQTQLEGSAKPCNCRTVKPDYVINSKKQNSAEEIHAKTAGPVSELSLQSNINLLLPSNDERIKTASVFATDKTVQSTQTLQHTSLPEIDDAWQETGIIDPVLIQKINASKSPAAKKMLMGIKAINTHIIAGPNLSFRNSKADFTGADHSNKPGVGFQLGFGSSFYFGDRFAIAPSLILKHNSGTETSSYTDTGSPGSPAQDYSSKYQYSYLSVPILAEIKISEQLTLMAGPELNLLLAAKMKSDGYGNSEKTDIKDHSVKTGVDIQAGLRYEIPGSPIGIQLIYDHRISRLNSKSSDYYGGGGYDNPAENMKSVQLGITCAICELLKHMRK